MNKQPQQKQSGSTDSFLGSIFTQCVAIAICPAFAMTIQATEMAGDVYADRMTSKKTGSDFEMGRSKSLLGIFDVGASVNANNVPEMPMRPIMSEGYGKKSNFGFSFAA